MADSDCEEWVPLRQAVVEVARAYSEFMLCEPAGALEAAQEAVLRSLEYGHAQARAPKWILNFNGTDDQPGWRKDQFDAPEIDMIFWGIYRNAETVVSDDWIAGDYSFSWDGNYADTREKEDPESDLQPYAYGLAIGLEVTRAGLPLIGGQLPQEPKLSDKGGRLERMLEERRGRRRKWDWEGALCYVISQANTVDGLPDGYGAQAEVGRMMAQWFRDNQRGEPATSEIGDRAARVMRAIDAHRK